jgi:membrane dipeptidase
MKYNLSRNLEIDRPDLDIDVQKLRNSNVIACVFALFIKQDGISCEETENRLLEQYKIFQEILKINPSLKFARNNKEIINNWKETKISLLLGIENGFFIGSKLNKIRKWHDLGVRYITLCHNKDNHICSSSTSNNTDLGLTDFGKSVVIEMNRIGMLIDISHLSDKSAEDVLNLSSRPIIATHSGNDNACHNNRNLKSNIIEKICKNQGLIGLTFLQKCVGNKYNIDAYMRHLKHFYYQIGDHFIGIGSDFDGGNLINDCKNVGLLKNVVQELRKTFNRNVVERITYQNALRLFE